MAGEGWQEIQLGQAIDIQHGSAFKGEYFRDEPPGDILLTPGNFAVGGGFKQDKVKYYAGPVPEEFVLAEGDLLITMTDLSRNADTLGYPAIVPALQGSRFLHNQRLGKVAILDDASMDKRFLFYLLCTREYHHEIVAGATGTTVKHTSPTRIKAYLTRVPRLPVQRAIACILGALDDKIELNRRMNETLEAMARAIFKSWFVDFDPVRAKAAGQQLPGLAPHIADLFPDEFEESELGEIPKGWRVGMIRDCCDRIQNGGTPKRSEPSYWQPATIPWLTSGEVRQEVIVETENRISEVGLARSSAKWLPADSTVVALYGATAGQVSFVAKDLTTNQAVCGLIPRPNHRYLNYLQLAASVSSLANLARGSAQQNISKGIVETTGTLLPDEVVLQEFDRALDPIFKTWVANLRANMTLAALRDTLLPKLISGELRVPDAERFMEDRT